MASFKSFEEMEIWKNAMNIALEIYQITEAKAFNSHFPLRDQIRRSAISISSNIAEGFDYGSNAHFVRFLYYAKGSAGEARSQIYILEGLGLIDKNLGTDLKTRLKDLGYQIGGFIKYLKQDHTSSH